MPAPQKVAGFLLATGQSISSIITRLGLVTFRAKSILRKLYTSQSAIPSLGAEGQAVVVAASQLSTKVLLIYLDYISQNSHESKVAALEGEQESVEEFIPSAADTYLCLSEDEPRSIAQEYIEEAEALEEEKEDKEEGNPLITCASTLPMIFLLLSSYCSTLRFIDLLEDKKEGSSVNTDIMIFALINALFYMSSNLKIIKEMQENLRAKERVIDLKKLQWSDLVVVCDVITTAILAYYSAQAAFDKLPVMLLDHLDPIKEEAAILFLLSMGAIRYVCDGKAIKENISGELDHPEHPHNRCGYYYPISTTIALAETLFMAFNKFFSFIHFMDEHGVGDLWNKDATLKQRAPLATLAGAITAVSIYSHWSNSKSQRRKIQAQITEIMGKSSSTPIPALHSQPENKEDYQMLPAAVQNYGTFGSTGRRAGQ